MKTKTVKLELQKGDDGYWLNFESSDGKKASINIKNKFPHEGTIDSCVRQWAIDQFKR